MMTRLLSLLVAFLGAWALRSWQLPARFRAKAQRLLRTDPIAWGAADLHG